jgi:hypothetical protein
MKTLYQIFISLICVFCFASCETTLVTKPVQPLKKDVFSGYVQKGPFVNGSSVTISELDTALNQTGRSYFTTIIDNSGSFEQKKIELISSFVQLKADGYYFNEVTGQLSSGQLTLYAVADISSVISANINVLTHLEKSRVEYLVSQKGLTFKEAKRQAQTEVLNVFSIKLAADSTSESLNLSTDGENNAVLLAVSCILQGQLSAAEMSQLMANISTDITTDGKLDSLSLGSRLLDNARFTNLATVRANLVVKYAELGLSQSVIPQFEKYVKQFMDSTTFKPKLLITYPDAGNYGANVLNTKDSVFLLSQTYQSTMHHYSMKADLPIGTTLKIIMKKGVWVYGALPAPINWTVSTYNTPTQTQVFNVVESGKPNDIDLMFISAGIVTIEFYENGATTPTRIKQIAIQ